MGLQEDFDALKRVHDSVNGKILQLEDKIAMLQQRNDILVAEKKQWVQQGDLKDVIIAQQLAASDNTVRQLQDEILELRDLLRKK